MTAVGTALATVYNIHVYPTANGCVGTIDPSSAPLSGSNGNHDQFLENLGQSFGPTTLNGFPGLPMVTVTGSPKVVTEMGLSTIAGQVDARTKAVNLVNGYLNAYFVDNFQYTFAYELYEQGDGYGLFSTTGTPNTAATYLHNLITILADAGGTAATFTPGSINFTLSNMPTGALYAITQKSNGHFCIIVWNNTTNYNLGTSTPITIGNTTITLTLIASANINTYDITSGTTATQTLTGVTTANMVLTDHAVIFDII